MTTILNQLTKSNQGSQLSQESPVTQETQETSVSNLASLNDGNLNTSTRIETTDDVVVVDIPDTKAKGKRSTSTKSSTKSTGKATTSKSLNPDKSNSPTKTPKESTKESPKESTKSSRSKKSPKESPKLEVEKLEVESILDNAVENTVENTQGNTQGNNQGNNQDNKPEPKSEKPKSKKSNSKRTLIDIKEGVDSDGTNINIYTYEVEKDGVIKTQNVKTRRTTKYKEKKFNKDEHTTQVVNWLKEYFTKYEYKTNDHLNEYKAFVRNTKLLKELVDVIYEAIKIRVTQVQAKQLIYEHLMPKLQIKISFTD